MASNERKLFYVDHCGINNVNICELQTFCPDFKQIIPDTKYTEPNAKNMKVPFYTYVWVTTSGENLLKNQLPSDYD